MSGLLIKLASLCRESTALQAPAFFHYQHIGFKATLALRMNYPSLD